MIPYLEIYLGTVALQFVVESVLEWRQYKMHQTKTLPKELSAGLRWDGHLQGMGNRRRC